MHIDKDKIKLWLITVITIFIDMLSKIIIKNNILYGESISIIRNFFYLTYVKNTGAAWSILRDNTWIIILITLIIIVCLVYYVIKNKLNNIEMISYGMIIGGSIGNLFDRVVYGYVIDFIDIYIFNYDYPVFNIADSAIVIGAIILLISLYRGEKDGINSK